MSSNVADIRVLVVAQDPLAGAGVAALLADQPGCTVVGQISSENDLSNEMEVYRPDVMLWDLGWNSSAALDGLSELRERSSPIVALLPDPAQANEAWSAGARGLLLRDVDASTLLATLRAVYEGLTVFAPELSTTRPAVLNREPGLLVEELTPRELEVLQLLAEGLPNKSITQKLSISEHTVKFHVNVVLGKIGAQSRTEAVIRATRLGLILL